MKLFLSTLATVTVAITASAQTASTGAASGSTAPTQLGTPLNPQSSGTELGTSLSTQGRSPGTFGTLENAEAASSFMNDSSTTSTTNAPTADLRLPGQSGPYYYLAPVSPNQNVPVYIAPSAPLPNGPGFDPGTVSGTTQAPTFPPANASPSPSATP